MTGDQRARAQGLGRGLWGVRSGGNVLEPPRLSKLQELFQELNKQSALCLYSLAEHHALVMRSGAGAFPRATPEEKLGFTKKSSFKCVFIQRYLFLSKLGLETWFQKMQVLKLSLKFLKPGWTLTLVFNCNSELQRPLGKLSLPCSCWDLEQVALWP